MYMCEQHQSMMIAASFSYLTYALQLNWDGSVWLILMTITQLCLVLLTSFQNIQVTR